MSPKDEAPLDIPRDQWGRPKILQLDPVTGEQLLVQGNGKNAGKPLMQGYQRISGLAKQLDEGHGLKLWLGAMSALGMALDADVLYEVQVLLQRYPEDTYQRARKELIRLAERAQVAAGSTVKRDLGTELHTWCQRTNRDPGALELVPDEMRADVLAYMWRTHELQRVRQEVFVVVDDVQAGGSLDELAFLPQPDGRLVVADLKTGQNEPAYPMGVEMQVSCYSRGQCYDPVTGARSPLWPDAEVDTSYGVLIHLPSGSGTCELYPLNLDRGWDNVQEAVAVKAARKASGRKLQPITEWKATA